MDLFAVQKWCISGNPGNTLPGRHLSVGSPSVYSQGMPCQVLWSGLLGLGRGGQHQLRFSKAVDSNCTACPHQPSMLNYSLLVKLQMFSVSPLRKAQTVHIHIRASYTCVCVCDYNCVPSCVRALYVCECESACVHAYMCVHACACEGNKDTTPMQARGPCYLGI